MKTIIILLLTAVVTCGQVALTYDGADDAVQVSDSASLDIGTSDFSMSIWFRRAVAGATQQLIEKSDGANDGYQLVILNTNVGRVRLDSGTGSTYDTTATFNDTKWHHIAVSIDRDGNLVYYVDGKQDATHVASDSGDLSNAIDFYIGIDTTSTLPMNGNIGTVMMYSRAICLCEAAAIHASGGAIYPREGLISRWTMNGTGYSTGQAVPNGKTIRDTTGTNNGTISDGADNSMTVASAPTRQTRGRR